MAKKSSQGQYNRGSRSYDTEMNFTLGMMYTDGMVDGSYVRLINNFNIDKQERSLVPRKGLVTSEIRIPEIRNDDIVDFQDADTNVTFQSALKETHEDGIEREQLIFLSEVNQQINLGTHMNNKAMTFDVPYPVSVTKNTGDIFKNTENLYSDMHSIVGTFAADQKYYCFNNVSGNLLGTYFDKPSDKYRLRNVKVKEPTASEAVTYGYNALLNKQTYSFKQGILAAGSIMQMEGLLPYSPETDELIMNPKSEELLRFQLFHSAAPGTKYRFIWEWRRVGDQGWTPLIPLNQAKEATVQPDGTIEGDSISFKPPHTDILIRVQAINTAKPDEIEKAITAGFDFKKVREDNLNPQTFDLSTAQGITAWKDQIVVHGVEGASNVLFVSAENDYGYFPYPNNISTFDEPITAVKPYLDGLVVFTTSQMHIVKRDKDSAGWTSEVVQNNLRIKSWDRHLIQVVKNMIFFKSGNYFFMMVPRSTSTTGELILAPVSNPMMKFFDDFNTSIKTLIQETYDYNGRLDFVKAYNFMDYDDIYNMFVFFSEESYITVACIYNINDRSWKLKTFNTEGPLYSYINEATQRGQLAVLTKHSFINEGDDTVYKTETAEPLFVEEFSEINRINRLENDFINNSNHSLIIKHANQEYEIVNIPITDPTVRLSDEFTFNKEETTFRIADIIFESSNVKMYAEDLIESYTGYMHKPKNISLNKELEYAFTFDTLPKGTVVEYNGLKTTMDNEFFKLTKTSGDQIWKLTFKTPFNMSNNHTLKVTYPNTIGVEVQSRILQIIDIESKEYEDKFVSTQHEFRHKHGVVNTANFNFVPISISETFKNYQLLDTGYRDRSSEHNKKYREIRMRINNPSKENLDFGLQFLLDGETRLGYWTSSTIGEEGLVYLEGEAYTNIKAEYVEEEDVLANFWTINQTEHPNQTVWWIKTAISGKGYAPRMKLLSRNRKEFSLSAITWVYRLMYVR